MTVKTFEAPSLEAALKLIKAELGPEALILSSQQKKGGWFQKPTVQVTAAFQNPPTSASDGFDEEELQQVFPHRGSSVRKTRLSRYQDLAPGSGRPPPANDAGRYQDGFRRAGLGEASALELSRRLAFEYPVTDLQQPIFLERARQRLLAESCKTLSWESFCARGTWVALGTAGSGKTSVLVKLALLLKSRQVGVSLLSADQRKVLGRRELMAYARLIRVPFSEEGKGVRPAPALQLLDTPALTLSPDCRDLQALCNGRAACVVLDASQRFEECLRVVDSVAALPLAGLIFTRLDLVSQYGLLHDVLKSTRLPLVGVSLSQSFKVPFRLFDGPALSKFILQGQTKE